MELPDYHGGSIVNLMRSIERTLDARPCDAAAAYPELSALPAEALSGARNIVLLVIDGLGYDYLIRDGAGGALQRHLKARIAGSRYAGRTRNCPGCFRRWPTTASPIRPNQPASNSRTICNWPRP